MTAGIYSLFEYLCRREEKWQVMSNRLLKSISSFGDTTIFQRIIYTVSRWKVPGVITWIPAYQHDIARDLGVLGFRPGGKHYLTLTERTARKPTDTNVSLGDLPHNYVLFVRNAWRALWMELYEYNPNMWLQCISSVCVITAEGSGHAYVITAWSKWRPNSCDILYRQQRTRNVTV